MTRIGLLAALWRREHRFAKLSRDTLMAIAVLVSASMNILIKVLSRVFSQLERIIASRIKRRR